MTRITVPPVVVRTTSDGGGDPQSVVAGMGRTPWEAIADLRSHAQAMVEEIAAEAAEDDGLTPQDFAYEVVGMLMGSGFLESGLPGWCAYGTLRRPPGDQDGAATAAPDAVPDAAPAQPPTSDSR
jgi:hypothetical protein